MCEAQVTILAARFPHPLKQHGEARTVGIGHVGEVDLNRGAPGEGRPTPLQDLRSGFEAEVAASREEETDEPATADAPAERKRGRLRIGRAKPDEEAPPAALAAMMEDRKADEAAAREAARIRLPDAAWASIRDRAASAGVAVVLEEDGALLRLSLGEVAA